MDRQLPVGTRSLGRVTPPVNRSGGDVADGKFARRLIYPSDEYKTNGVNLNRAVGKDLSNGGDRLSTHVWWDCNPKLVNE